MARENLVFLTGSVAGTPRVAKNGEDYIYAMAYVNVARGLREVGDYRKYMKCDNPIIMTRDPDWMKEIGTWKEHDIVHIKGMIACRKIKKTSFCSHCRTKNQFPGALVYINPIFCEKICHLENDEECLQYLAAHREISNQVFVFGTLCRDPKKMRVKDGLIVTQYQVALNRKYRIKTDPPELKTDYPWVKSYGKNAEEDMKRLHTGSEVFIDGCLQARSVNRHAVCGQAYDEYGKPLFFDNGMPVMRVDEEGNLIGCGEKYDWKDRALEMVPYETEYISDVYTDEEIEETEKKKIAQVLRDKGLLIEEQEGENVSE